ncbi:MAG: ATP-binding cassette domain-containing protein [Clostridiaceae bacterium]|jgi:lincosamide and streptogramin A transport system ATP-binding/permease protein|nr:ATP-binding cassette domain-containing protein [Clostridiaceae bacterium]
MSIISVTDLTFAYDGSYDDVFKNVSFRFDTDWRLGFIGRNGKGKTTFLNLLQGKYKYSGTITASVEFTYFPFHTGDMSKLTADVAEEAAGAGFELWRVKRELSLLDTDADDLLYRPFDSLSNGERTKVLLAALFLRENNFLLIDEPTNHLDTRAREVVGNYLKGKKGFILVSHDRRLLDICTDHIISVNRSEIDVQQGNFSSWLLNKEARDLFELRENERLEKDIKRLRTAAGRVSDWADKTEKAKFGEDVPDRGFVGHKSAKMQARSKAIEGRLSTEAEEKTKLLKNLERQDELPIRIVRYHSERLLEFRDVSVSYDGKTVCSGVTFTLNRGDRVALVGKNGSGKSSILRLVMGEELTRRGTVSAGGADLTHTGAAMVGADLTRTGTVSVGADLTRIGAASAGAGFMRTGTVTVGSGLKIAYVPQDTSFLAGNLKDFARDGELDESLFKAVLRKLDFAKEQFDKDMADFSEGQKKKVLLAASLSRDAHLYVWDEPLNYIDLISRVQLEDLLAERQPSMLFVEHDAAFTEKIATKIVEI